MLRGVFLALLMVAGRMAFADAYDPADNNAAAGSLLLPSAIVQTHGPHDLSSGDSDWFRISLVRGNVYRFAQAPSPDGQIASGVFAKLFSDPAGSHQVASWDNPGGNASTTSIEYRAPADGVYYLQVFLSGQSGAGYSLQHSIAGFLDIQRPTARGKIRIIHNVLRPGSGLSGIAATGTPGGKVVFVLSSQSGIPQFKLGEVILDSNGEGLLIYDGRYHSTGNNSGDNSGGDGKPLKAGVYWVVATGAVEDQKPLVLTTRRADIP